MLETIIFFTPITELIISIYVLGIGLLISPLFFKLDEIKYNLNEISLFGFCLILPIVQITNLILTKT